MHRTVLRAWICTELDITVLELGAGHLKYLPIPLMCVFVGVWSKLKHHGGNMNGGAYTLESDTVGKDKS